MWQMDFLLVYVDCGTIHWEYRYLCCCQWLCVPRYLYVIVYWLWWCLYYRIVVVVYFICYNVELIKFVDKLTLQYKFKWVYMQRDLKNLSSLTSRALYYRILSKIPLLLYLFWIQTQKLDSNNFFLSSTCEISWLYP